MVEVYKTSDIINRLLVQGTDRICFEFFVHSSIYDKFIKLCNATMELNVYDYELQINKRFYDMKLIVFRRDRQNQNYTFMINLMSLSQFSFPWEDRVTLYSDFDSLHLLEEFIGNHNLHRFIVKTEKITAVSKTNEAIQVITFSKKVHRLDLIENYRKWMQKCSYHPSHYYITKAFPWFHHPTILPPFHYNKIYSTFCIVLNHSNELNIFDLISLRFALCDFQNCNAPTSNRLAHEIDYLIRRALAHMSSSYIENDEFDLNRYATDQNLTIHADFLYYLVYEYQQFFKTIKISDDAMSLLSLHGISTVSATVRLVEHSHSAILLYIKEKCNVKFIIDGRDYDGMNLQLFRDILGCSNIKSIILDTNYTWTDNASIDRNGHQIMRRDTFVDVHLIGDNTRNFLGPFLSSLKAAKNTDIVLNLFVKCKISSFRIFDNLTVNRLTFENIRIDSKMLLELHACNLRVNDFIRIMECWLTNESENWKLLYNLNSLWDIFIWEDENTWQTLFEFISTELMINLSLVNFEFTKLITILSNSRKVMLNEMYFTIDKDNSKLQLRGLSNQLIDLYHFKNQIEPDEKCNYEFYQ